VTINEDRNKDRFTVKLTALIAMIERSPVVTTER